MELVEIIDALLKNKASIETDKEAEILAYAKELDVVKAYMAELDIKYQERAEKIDKMLEAAGYVEFVDLDEVEVIGEIEEVGEVEDTTNNDWR